MTVNHWVTGSSPVRGASQKAKDVVLASLVSIWRDIKMYAVISSGGKQYKVAEGEVIKLEKLPEAVDQIVEFPVMLVVNKTDNKTDVKAEAASLVGSMVRARVVEHGRGDKITIIKFRRRKHHRKQMGHRQHYTAVKITEIL